MAGASVNISVFASVEQAQRALQQVQRELDKVGTVSTRADAKMRASAQRMVASGKKMSIGLSLPLAFVAKKAIDAASALNEQMSKVDVVFGASAVQIQEWAETTAEGFGISRNAALEAAGAFGNMFTTVGLVGPEAAAMSQRFVELASDMASFNDEDPSDMLVRLRSGLAGEAEPLRRFGVLLSAARVEQEAMRLGLVRTGQELTEAAKVQARYSLILKDSQVQQGNFALTAEGTANQMRITSATAEDAAASFGQVLQPVTQELLKITTELLKVFAGLPGPVKTAVVALAGIGIAAGPILTVIGKLWLLQLSLKRTAAAGNTTSLALLKIGKAAGIVGLALTAVSIGFEQGRKEQEKLVAHIRDKLVPAFVEGQLSQEKFTRETELWIRLGAVTREELDGWVAGLRTQQTETKNSERELEKLNRTIEKASDKTRVFANLTKQEFKEWRNNVRGSLNPVAGALERLGDKAKLTSDKVIRAFRRQAKNLAEYNDNLRDVAKKNLPASVLKQILDMGEDGAGILATLADANKSEWKDIVDAMKGARREIRETQRTIDSLKGKNVEVGFKIGPFGINLPKAEKRAHGGPVFGGRSYIVGERRPEVFIPKQDGRILPSVGGGGGITQNVSVSVMVNGNADPNRLARELAPAITRELNRAQKGSTRSILGDPV